MNRNNVFFLNKIKHWQYKNAIEHEPNENVKGTVRVISSDPRSKDDNARDTWKPYIIKYELESNVPRYR